MCVGVCAKKELQQSISSLPPFLSPANIKDKRKRKKTAEGAGNKAEGALQSLASFCFVLFCFSSLKKKYYLAHKLWLNSEYILEHKTRSRTTQTSQPGRGVRGEVKGRKEDSWEPRQNREIQLIGRNSRRHCWTGLRGDWGGKAEELTYIVSFLALCVLVQTARLAVAAPLVVLAVVPRRGSVGTRGGWRRAAGFLLIRLVFGVGPEGVRSPR